MPSHYWKKVITRIKQRLMNFRGDMFKLDELMSKVTEENKHALVFDERPMAFNSSAPADKNVSFTIQIHVEPYEESQKRWRRQTQAIKEGHMPEVTRHLSFELWEDFLNILTDEGKAMIEDMRGD